MPIPNTGTPSTRYRQLHRSECASHPPTGVSHQNLRTAAVWSASRPGCHLGGIMVSPDKLSLLFKSYHAPLVRFLTRRLGDRDWAEEIAQETFVRALKQETIASDRSWLFAVA